jgi:hypothetical protein
VRRYLNMRVAAAAFSASGYLYAAIGLVSWLNQSRGWEQDLHHQV